MCSAFAPRSLSRRAWNLVALSGVLALIPACQRSGLMDLGPLSLAPHSPEALRVGLPAPSYNAAILRAIGRMPRGGGYSTALAAHQGLEQSMELCGSRLRLRPDQACPSYCSGATYQVFLFALADLGALQAGSLAGRGGLDELLMRQQPDGQGVWGRWNSNGPGTASLFRETGLGVNFTNPTWARAGDFLKIFWNEHIGRREAGHSVVFLGWKDGPQGETYLRYWSSNQPGGYGVACVPLSKVRRMLFSRLSNPRAVDRLAGLGVDAYLKSMLSVDGSPARMKQVTASLP